ncbi:tryptophan synthase alpha chain [Bacillus mesophilus]|uniref:Tryptophan synthase alpha chain n=1 Tax=Bacillus mesophilus TaxID=1808955 RepID=A0A6M0Q851_9BACI|nr:tryptophan synthase subunit alpha [Bacillus mesophilus]MBM7661257.1 tryptophan synthase alpha chain [Bacillus mesophilus]NEY71218.1 tryptophan synthase subunit alpha [Bacillus mesophilus]
MTTSVKRTIPTTEFLFIPFIVAGFPDEETTVDLALMLQKLGASALELGVPYSDPLADGPIIQEAASKALKNGMSIKKAMNLVSVMRNRGVNIPIILFTYYNPVLQLGEESFFALAKENDIDGLLVPDIPFEESGRLRSRCKEEGLFFISLVAPTSEKRIEMIAKEAEGFLYCVSSLGVTGVRKELHESVYPFLESVKKHSNIPVAVGFGISNADQVTNLLPVCDGVIVGSALLKKLADLETNLQNFDTKAAALEEFENFVKSIISPISV